MYLLYIFFCLRLNIFYYSTFQFRPYLLSSLFQMLYFKILNTSIWFVVMNSRFLENYWSFYLYSDIYKTQLIIRVPWWQLYYLDVLFFFYCLSLGFGSLEAISRHFDWMLDLVISHCRSCAFIFFLGKFNFLLAVRVTTLIQSVFGRTSGFFSRLLISHCLPPLLPQFRDDKFIYLHMASTSHMNFTSSTFLSPFSAFCLYLLSLSISCQHHWSSLLSYPHGSGPLPPPGPDTWFNFKCLKMQLSCRKFSHIEKMYNAKLITLEISECKYFEFILFLYWTSF